MFSESKHFSFTSSVSSNSYCTPLAGSRIYMAGKLSRPGLYENLSTNRTLRDAKVIPGSTTTFLTSLPSCRKIVTREGSVPACALAELDSAVIRGGSGVLERVEGKGGTAGARLSGVLEREYLCLMVVSGMLVGPGSSSSTSVKTANSFAVRFPVAAKDRRLGWLAPRTDRSRLVEAPVIFEMLYTENRFEARRSSNTSFDFKAASD